MNRKRKAGINVLPLLLFLVVAAGVVFAFFSAVNKLDEGQGDDAREQVERAIRSAAVACYAAEGRYPPDMDYLRAHYGIQMNEDKYTVFYVSFAENLMPDITVLKKGQED